MTFLAWYCTGVITLISTFWIEAYRRGYGGHGLKYAFYQIYEILVKKASILSTFLLAVTALLGPLLILLFAYFIIHNWYYGINIDEEGKKD